MPRLKYTTLDQKLAASRASAERDRQRKKLETACSRLSASRPDTVGFIAAFWEARQIYLEMERLLEQMLWNDGIMKRSLLLESTLTQKGESSGKPTSPPIDIEEKGDSVVVSDSGV